MEIGLRAAGGQRRMTAPEEQFRPLDAAIAAELVAKHLLFQRVGEGEVQGGGPELA